MSIFSLPSPTFLCCYNFTLKTHNLSSIAWFRCFSQFFQFTHHTSTVMGEKTKRKPEVKDPTHACSVYSNLSFADNPGKCRQDHNWVSAFLSKNAILNWLVPRVSDALYKSSILGGFFVSGTIPLFYELTVESTYPVAEGVTTGALTLINNSFTVIFLFVLMIPGVGKSSVDMMFSNLLMIHQVKTRKGGFDSRF